jgi:hypothetical protein
MRCWCLEAVEMAAVAQERRKFSSEKFALVKCDVCLYRMSCGPFSLKPFRQSVVEGNVTPCRCLELLESASYCSSGHFDLAMVVSFFTIRFFFF